MDKNKSQKTDEEIVREFESLFHKLPEPETGEEIEKILNDAGYDVKDLQTKGLEFANNLMANNWRFVTSDEIDDAAKRINEIPFRNSWTRSHLLDAIQKVSQALGPSGKEPVLAHRNLGKLADADLAAILQELEYKASMKGIKLNLE